MSERALVQMLIFNTTPGIRRFYRQLRVLGLDRNTASSMAAGKGCTMTAWSNPKPDLEECVCGCGLVARPRAKAWQDGLGPHARGCACRRCAGGRQRPRSRVRENRIAKDTGGERSPLSGATNGYDGRAGLWRWEETSNVEITRGFLAWINGKGVQRKVRRLFELRGVNRALILSIDNKPEWVVVKYEDWAPMVKDSE